MTHRIFVGSASVLALVAALTPAEPVHAQRTNREHGVVVTAMNGDLAPVPNLGVADFIVREDELAREVIRVSPAPPPSHLMLLVDDSQASAPSVPFLRSALNGFLDRMTAMTPAPELGFMTFGERPTLRAGFSPDPAPVRKAISTIFPITGSGAYFMQAIGDACADLRKRTAQNPIIVAFVAESGPEFSTETRRQIADALRSAGASLWVIVLQNARQTDQSPEARERAAVIGDVATASGGMNRVTLSGQSLEPAFESLAALLASRYLVVYGRPDQMIPPSSITVSAKRQDVRVLAARWVQ
jgi:hypothetical protein